MGRVSSACGPGYGAAGLTSRVSELAECRKCLCVIRFWSETGGGAGGGEVRSQPARAGGGEAELSHSFLLMGWRSSGLSAQA